MITALSLFKGELTADAVTARASAGTGYSGAGGNANGSGITNLKVDGQPVADGVSKVALGDWGQLTVGTQSVDRTASAGTQGYHGFVTELDVRLTADHGGLPASSEIQVGYAEAAAQTAPPPTVTVTTPTDTVPAATGEDPSAGDAPRLRPKQGGPRKSVPLKLQPKLTAGRYVYPVYGASSYIDTYGATRADVTYHHGDDIFGQLGQPLLAVADGTVFSVGWNKVGGNRLWILDAEGNQFYYAHLSAFTTTASNGAHVKGRTGGGLHGEHRRRRGHALPPALRGAPGIAALSRLRRRRRSDAVTSTRGSTGGTLPFPMAPRAGPRRCPAGRPPPEPGAILLGMNDISTADGLDPASLERALSRRRRRRALMARRSFPTVPRADDRSVAGEPGTRVFS